MVVRVAEQVTGQQVVAVTGLRGKVSAGAHHRQLVQLFLLAVVVVLERLAGTTFRQLAVRVGTVLRQLLQGLVLLVPVVAVVVPVTLGLRALVVLVVEVVAV
jgi:hypothetical protein